MQLQASTPPPVIAHLEDDLLVQVWTKQALRKSSFSAVRYRGCNSVDELLGLLTKTHCEVILLDVIIANECLVGPQIVDSIRAKGYQGAIIIYSQLPEQHIGRYFAQVEVDDYLLKNANEKKLLTMIDSWIKDKRYQQAALKKKVHSLLKDASLNDLSKSLKIRLQHSYDILLKNTYRFKAREISALCQYLLTNTQVAFTYINCSIYGEALLELILLGEAHSYKPSPQALGTIGLLKKNLASWVFLDDWHYVSSKLQAKILTTTRCRIIAVM